MVLYHIFFRCLSIWLLEPRKALSRGFDAKTSVSSVAGVVVIFIYVHNIKVSLAKILEVSTAICCKLKLILHLMGYGIIDKREKGAKGHGYSWISGDGPWSCRGDGPCFIFIMSLENPWTQFFGRISKALTTRKWERVWREVNLGWPQWGPILPMQA